MNSIELHTGKSFYYDQYRPSYPMDVLNYLVDQFQITDKVVADIGCGTGIFTRQLSIFTKKIYAVEPNIDMFERCLEYSASFNNIVVMRSSAEQTDLDEHSVDLITVATAFHWFEHDAFRQECMRILRPMGQVALLINSPGAHNTIDVLQLSALCEEIGLNFSYSHYKPLVNLQSIYKFFKHKLFICRKFPNDLMLNRDQFIGRYLSMHYAPLETDTRYYAFLKGLELIFEKYKQGDTVFIPNKTIVFVGILQ
jgi:SAM-dependent methyltransferase